MILTADLGICTHIQQPLLAACLTTQTKKAEDFPFPLWFLFSRDCACAVTSKTYNPPSEGPATLGEDGRPTTALTSYNYVCLEGGQKVLRPMAVSPELYRIEGNDCYL
jgi:hypothetical protein